MRAVFLRHGERQAQAFILSTFRPRWSETAPPVHGYLYETPGHRNNGTKQQQSPLPVFEENGHSLLRRHLRDPRSHQSRTENRHLLDLISFSRLSTKPSRVVTLKPLRIEGIVVEGGSGHVARDKTWPLKKFASTRPSAPFRSHILVCKT